MFLRFCLSVVLAMTLSACESVPEKYAFWRDDASGRGLSETSEPNLADVPASPNAADAKTELEAIQARLAAERQKAYQEVYGYTTGAETGSDQPAPQFNEMHEVPAPDADYQYPQHGGGNVQYNYDSSSEPAYVYGYSNVQIAHSGQSQGGAYVAGDNITIDLSTLDAATAPSLPEPTYGLSGSASPSGLPLVYFSHGSASLDARDRSSLRELAEELKSQQSSVVIAGHASKRTGIGNVLLSRDVNLRMSAKRANAVMRELAKYGVSPEQIFVTAYGDSMPNISDSQGLSQEDADRRVEILFDK
jgi:outer membrane protein OmpA-like peptidoglycan-associated protein